MASPPKSRNTVWVGCKIPNGLSLAHEELQDVVDPGTGGTRKAWVPTGDRVVLNGANSSNVFGGYGRTRVDADWFAHWLEQSANDRVVKSGEVFAEPTAEAFEKGAADRKDVSTGMEPLNPEQPGRGLEQAPDA